MLSLFKKELAFVILGLHHLFSRSAPWNALRREDTQVKETVHCYSLLPFLLVPVKTLPLPLPWSLCCPFFPSQCLCSLVRLARSASQAVASVRDFLREAASRVRGDPFGTRSHRCLSRGGEWTDTEVLSVCSAPPVSHCHPFLLSA